MPERPERMKRKGRPEDQEFAAAEKLFRRYVLKHYINGQFSGLGFAFPAQSVNREKYSEPLDALFSEKDEFAGWGVLSFKVEDVSASLPVDDPQYKFLPKHVPQEDNYAHSEVWCDSVPPTGQYVEPSSRIKKLFRAALSQKVAIEITATV